MLQCGFVRSNFAFAMMDHPRRQKPCCAGAGAGEGYRTHVASLHGWSLTIELHPRRHRREPRHATPPVVEFRKLLGRGWWRGKDSKLRRPKSADLQSAAFDRSATPPLAFRQRPGDKGLLPLCQRAPSPTALRAAAVFRGGISRRICSTAGAFDKEERLEERNAMARFPEVSPKQYTDEQNELAQKVAGSRGAMRAHFVPD